MTKKTSRRRPTAFEGSTLHTRLAARIIGQTAAIDAIVPFVQTFQAGLSPEGRPVAVFLLLGPTGTGKTKTVESLAEVLHGSAKSMIRIDCGEYQMEHEVSKLIGAPPGYLGHRETNPLLTQAKLNAVTSDGCNLSIVLFDEIEKAAPSMNRLLLGILDKAALRLGDNSTVNFERTIIFLTSNLGARGMMKELGPKFGFQPRENVTPIDRLRRVAEDAAKRKFAPEFMNRIDSIVTYNPLSEGYLRAILDLQIDELQKHISKRLGVRAFEIHVSEATRKALLEKGVSQQFGAREIKRTLHRMVTQPLAGYVAEGAIPPGACVHIVPNGDQFRFRLAA